MNGFCREVLQALPMEFAMEAQQLVAISLEGARLMVWGKGAQMIVTTTPSIEASGSRPITV